MFPARPMWRPRRCSIAAAGLSSRRTTTRARGIIGTAATTVPGEDAMTSLTFNRRHLLSGAAALGAVAAAGPLRASAAPPKLPARGNFVIRNAYVMTMEKRPATSRTATCTCAMARSSRSDRTQRARRAHHRRPRHDRAAGLRRDALAHVEHAVARHVGREAGLRLFPHHRHARQAVARPTTCIRARGLRPPRRSTPASPSCTTGATTSAAPIIARADLRALKEVRAARALLLRTVAGPRRQGSRSICPTSKSSRTTGRSIPTTA